MTVISATRSTSTENSVVFFGKDQPRQVIAVRILLPVDEMLGGSDLKRIAGNRRPAMRRRAQAHHMRRKPYRPGIAIESLVIQRDSDAHGILYRGNLPFPRPMFIGSGETDTREIIQERVQGPAETPFQLFYGQDMKQRGSGREAWSVGVGN